MTGSEPHRSQGSVASIDQTRTRAAEAVSTTELSQIFALMISALRNSNRNLSELCFENGDWIMREPGNSEQVRETLGHTQELRGVTTVPLAGAGQIIQDQSPASVTNMQQLLMSEEGQRTGDWLDTPGSGSEPLPRPVSQHHHHCHCQVIIRTKSPSLLRETSPLCLTLTRDFTQSSKSQMLTF